jgi:hypothetical protein
VAAYVRNPTTTRFTIVTYQSVGYELDSVHYMVLVP